MPKAKMRHNSADSPVNKTGLFLPLIIWSLIEADLTMRWNAIPKPTKTVAMLIWNYKPHDWQNGTHSRFWDTTMTGLNGSRWCNMSNTKSDTSDSADETWFSIQYSRWCTSLVCHGKWSMICYKVSYLVSCLSRCTVCTVHLDRT